MSPAKPDGQWYCRVCGQPSPDYKRARRNPKKKRRNVVALPCRHEQPSEPMPGEDVYRGLGYRPPRFEA